MAQYYYDGTSAYKLDQYENYTRKVQQKQNSRNEYKKQKLLLGKKRMAIALGLVFIIATAFLYANAALMQASSEVTNLTKELEDMKVRNTQVSFDIVSGVDYNAVEQKAITQFGMQHPESYQNVYVNVVQNDYAELASEKTVKKSTIDEIISGVQSFFAYIRLQN